MHQGNLHENIENRPKSVNDQTSPPGKKALRFTRPVILVFALSIFYCFFIFLLAYLRYRCFINWNFEENAFHNNLLWNTIHGNPFFVSSYGFQPYLDHFQPITLLFSLFYWISPHLLTMHLLFALCAAGGGIFLFLITQEKTKNPIIALLVTATWFVYHPLIQALLTDGDPILFTPVFLMGMVYFFEKGRLKLSLGLMVASLMCHELIAPSVFLFSLFHFREGMRQKDRPVTVYSMTAMIISVTWFLVSILVSLKFAYSPFYSSIFFGESGAGSINLKLFVSQLFQAPLKHQLHYYLIALSPLLFIPMVSRWFVIASPMIVATFLHKDPMNYVHLYLLVPIISFLFLGLVDVVVFAKQRFEIFKKEGSKNLVRIMVLLVLLNLSFTLFNSAFPIPTSEKDIRYTKDVFTIHRLLDSRLYKQNEIDRQAWEMVTMIPPDVSVASDVFCMPPLSHRTRFFPFRKFDYFTNELNVGPIDYLLIFEKPEGISDTLWPWSWQDDQYLQRMKIKLEKIANQWGYERIAQKGGFSIWALPGRELAAPNMID